MNQPPSIPASRAPVALWFLGFVLLGIAVCLSPRLLVWLGPMRGSLTSANEMTRQTAETTVLLGRVVFGLLAASFLAVAVFYRSLAGSRWAQALSRHEPLETARHRTATAGWANISFRVMMAGLGLGLVYILLGPKLPVSIRAEIQREDGIIEMGTALIFLICSATTAVLAFQYLKLRGTPDGNRSIVRRAGWCFALAFFFFVCVGEEISWGQRIFGWATPESLKRANVQDETNVHNLFGYLADHLFSIGMVCYLGILPLLAGGSDAWRRAMDWIGLPMASRGLAVGILAVFCLQDWLIFRIVPNTTGLRAGELRELLASFAFALLIYESRLLLPSKA